MKIQELAIIFIIIILPISLVLSEYTQFQIKTISLQTEYDAKLTAATYDAIKAFQLNTQNESYADITNRKLADLTASIQAFRNSLMAGFKLNGYKEDELNNYIPALVYTLYDGFYIYSPYNNENHRYLVQQTAENGETINVPATLINDSRATNNNKTDGNGDTLYGIKPYINYSCRYINGDTDVVITYALDNYIKVQGIMENPDTGTIEYVNKSGYLIDGIEILPNRTVVKYNTIEIQKEHLKESIYNKDYGDYRDYSYIKQNGVKYYYVPDYIDDEGNTKPVIATISNGEFNVDILKSTEIGTWKDIIENNNNAQQYYINAYDFTKWFKSSNLKNLKYEDAVDIEVVVAEDGSTTVNLVNIWENNITPIFDFNATGDFNSNIENESSEFNQHRLAVIRHKIETNLAIAIANYNTYSGAANFNEFQMPELKETEWEHITHNISVISFLQGLHIGGKVYNGYSLVTNSESKEVVLENNIYILGDDKYYHKIGDEDIVDGTVNIDVGNYGEGVQSAGRLNLDFNRAILKITNDVTRYYYPLKEYNASYNSVVMQNGVNTDDTDDIYVYVAKQLDNGNEDLAKAFYTALGRERFSQGKSNLEY